MFRRLRAVLGHSRVPLSVEAQNAKVYRIRFLPPRNTPLIPRALLSATCYGVLGYYWYISYLRLTDGSPKFIPIELPKVQEPPPYAPDDPAMKVFHKFAQDREGAITIKREFALAAGRKLYQIYGERKLGVNPRFVRVMIYLSHPTRPPPIYVQRGVCIRPAPDESDSTWHRMGAVEFKVIERELEPTDKQVRLMHQIRNPLWALRAVKREISVTYGALKGGKWPPAMQRTAGRGEDSEEATPPDNLVDFGAGVTQQTYRNLKTRLRRMWVSQLPPPPRGHAIIDGVIELRSDKCEIAIDVVASFDPQKPGIFFLRQFRVRYYRRLSLEERLEASSAPGEVTKGKTSQPDETLRLAAEKGKQQARQLRGVADKINEQDSKIVRELMERKKADAETEAEGTNVGPPSPTVPSTSENNGDSLQTKPTDDAPASTEKRPEKPAASPSGASEPPSSSQS